jgi:hypothetical protein
MATQGFQVHVSGGTVSIDAWRRAKDAPEMDLPSLSDAQKEAALKVGMEESEYARGILADELARRDQQEKGRRLGEIITDFLKAAGQDWELSSLVRKGVGQVWVAHFEASGRVSEIEIPLELADDVVDSGEQFSKARLGGLITAQLENSAVRKAS